jgi:hypothetical protein
VFLFRTDVLSIKSLFKWDFPEGIRVLRISWLGPFWVSALLTRVTDNKRIQDDGTGHDLKRLLSLFCISNRTLPTILFLFKKKKKKPKIKMTENPG